METLPPTQSPLVGAGPNGLGARPPEVETVLGASGQRRRRRTRRRSSTLRRLLHALEPFGLVLALCILSMGVITVVEGTVATKAEFEDAQRFKEERENMREEVRELVETLDSGWAPSFQEGEDLFFGDELADLRVEVDPFAGLVKPPGADVNTAMLPATAAAER